MADDETGDNTSQIKFEAHVTASGKWCGVSHGTLDVCNAWIICAHVYLRACV